MLETFKENKQLYLYWILSLLIISLSVVTSSFLSLLPLIIFVIALLKFEHNDAYTLLLGLVPFAGIFKVQPGTISLFVVCEVLFCLYVLFKTKKVHIGFLLSTICLSIYILLVSYEHFELTAFIKFIVGMYLIYYARYLENKDIRNIGYVLSISVMLMMILSNIPAYFQYVVPYLHELKYLRYPSGEFMYIFRNSGFIGDPNYCTSMIIITLSFISVIYYYEGMGKEFWIIFPITLILGLQTYSKSFFLSSILLLMFFYFKILLSKNIKIIFANFAFCLFALYFIVDGRVDAINLVVSRIFSNADFTTGRGYLNEIYLDYIFDDVKILFLGAGMFIETIEEGVNNVHNLYIEILLKLGLLGSIMLITTMYFTITNNKNKLYKISVVNYLPLFFFLLLYSFLAGLLNYATPFYIIIAILSLKYYNKEIIHKSSSHVIDKEII